MADTIPESLGLGLFFTAGLLFREGHEGIAFRWFEEAEFSGLEGIEREVADSDADEAFDAVAYGLNHVADLPFEAGIKDHFHAAGRESFYGDRAGFSDFGEDSFFELAENRVLEGVLSGDLIELFNAVARVSERLGEFAVIAEDEEAFGLEVKASYVSEVVKARGEEFVNGGSAIFIVACADEAGGLVHHDGLSFQRLDALAAGLDEITWLNPIAGIEADLTIDDDFAIEDEFIAAPAGANARRSEEFVEADAFGCW